MASTATIVTWCALCLGCAFSEQETGCLGSWTCTKLKSCANPQVVVKDGEQSLRTCVTSEGQNGVCCTTGAADGRISKKKCKDFGKSVFTKAYNSITGASYEQNNCPDAERTISGGDEANPKEFPHMALIGSFPYENLVWHCGGSLVSELYVLSAAHCTAWMDVMGNTWVAKMVRLGEYNYTSSEDEEFNLAQPKDYDIVEWLVHPGWTSEDYDPHDIALYKLNSSVEFNEFVRPICLNSNPNLPETEAIVSGWGVNNTETDQVSDLLLKAKVKIMTCDRVDVNIIIPDVNKPSLICAGDLDNEKDQCNGDSGGPLQINLEDPYCMFAVVGVASFGPRPCGKKYHSCYTRVSYYLHWIESIVWYQK